MNFSLYNNYIKKIKRCVYSLPLVNIKYISLLIIKSIYIYKDLFKLKGTFIYLLHYKLLFFKIVNGIDILKK